jgi:hypothetical protein
MVAVTGYLALGARREANWRTGMPDHSHDGRDPGGHNDGRHDPQRPGRDFPRLDGDHIGRARIHPIVAIVVCTCSQTARDTAWLHAARLAAAGRPSNGTNRPNCASNRSSSQETTMRTALRGAAFLLTVATLAGCTGPARSTAMHHAGSTPSRSAGAGPPSRPAVDAEQQVSCGRPRQSSRPLPPGFIADVAVLCEPVLRQLHGRHRIVVIRQVADHGLTALVAALRRPSVQPSPGLMCPLLIVPVTLLYLIDRDGDIVRPKIPTDACGQPQQQFFDALRLVPWVASSPPSALP